jgi:hypothetical protein
VAVSKTMWWPPWRSWSLSGGDGRETLNEVWGQERLRRRCGDETPGLGFVQ